MIPKYRSSLNFIFGSLAGVIATTILYPTHMIKRVFQANSNFTYIKPIIDDHKLRISTWIIENFRKNGISYFYKGMLINYIKIIPYQGLLFWTNERLKIALGYEQLNKH